MRLTPILVGLMGCAEPLIGSGQLIEDRRVLEDFTAVETFGVNTRVAMGDAEDVVIHTDHNLQVYVTTTVEDGVLRIEVDDELFPTLLTALVVVPSLTAVSNHSSADLWVSGLDTQALSVMASGSGSTELLGSVESLTLLSSGTGVRNAGGLTAAEVSVEITGSGTAWMTATDSISGTLSNTSLLNVFGDPSHKAVETDSASEVIYY